MGAGPLGRFARTSSPIPETRFLYTDRLPSRTEASLR